MGLSNSRSLTNVLIFHVDEHIAELLYLRSQTNFSSFSSHLTWAPFKIKYGFKVDMSSHVMTHRNFEVYLIYSNWNADMAYNSVIAMAKQSVLLPWQHMAWLPLQHNLFGYHGIKTLMVTIYISSPSIHLWWQHNSFRYHRNSNEICLVTTATRYVLP